MAKYGWIITKAEEEFDLDSGAMGPADISREHERMLNEGAGEKFRMYDDDGEFYYEGLIIGEYEGFEPLDDYGMPNAGATEIRYLKDGKWVML